MLLVKRFWSYVFLYHNIIDVIIFLNGRVFKWNIRLFWIHIINKGLTFSKLKHITHILSLTHVIGISKSVNISYPIVVDRYTQIRIKFFKIATIIPSINRPIMCHYIKSRWMFILINIRSSDVVQNTIFCIVEKWCGILNRRSIYV